MKVAIDAGPLESRDAIRGIGIHTKELVSRLQKIKNLEIDLIDARKTDLSKYNVVHYPFFHPHFVTLPKKFATKTVVTIHDLIRLIYPEAYPPGIKGQLRFLVQKNRVKKADAIITISETSKKDIVRFLGISPEKVHVIYLGPQTIKQVSVSSIKQTKQKYNLPDKFVLYVGDVNYNKNILTLAKAAKLAKFPLVMMGKQAVEKNFDKSHPENKSWVEFLKLYEDDSDVIRLGFLENHEFAAVWKLASVYCQPSFYEGFGLPIIEAFGQNVPVIAAKTQALVEVGADAAVYFDPHNSQELTQQLKNVTQNKSLSNELVKKGQKRLKDFSWESAAQQTYEVYKRI